MDVELVPIDSVSPDPDDMDRVEAMSPLIRATMARNAFRRADFARRDLPCVQATEQA